METRLHLAQGLIQLAMQILSSYVIAICENVQQFEALNSGISSKHLNPS